MIKIFLAFTFACSVCFGAVPTFNSFNNSQFSASQSQNNVSISDGADMTNTVQKTVYISGRQYIQDTLSGTNNPIDFTHYSYWNIGSSAAVRFNIAGTPSSTNSADCIVTMVGNIGSVFTNVADSIAWLGPWGVLNATNTTVTIRWNGTNLIAWQDPMHGVATIAQWVANTDNFDAGVNDEIRVSTDAARNLTGIVGRPGGQQLTVENVGSFTITLKNNVTSTATNRFIMAQDIALGANQNITLIYDLTSLRWHPIAMASVTEPNLFFSDVTTANATSSLHGLLPKLDANSEHFLDGTGAFSRPAGGTVGTLINTTATAAGNLVQFTDANKTNTAPVTVGAGLSLSANTLSVSSASGTIYECTLTGVTNLTAETTLWSNNVAIAANQLGTNKLCRVFIEGDMLNNSAATTATRTYKLYLGGTSAYSAAFVDPSLSANSALRVPWEMTIDIQNLNSTAVQEVSSRYLEGARGATAPDSGSIATVALMSGKRLTQMTKDTTANLSIGFTVTMSAADANIWIERFRVIVTFP